MHKLFVNLIVSTVIGLISGVVINSVAAETIAQISETGTSMGIMLIKVIPFIFGIGSFFIMSGMLTEHENKTNNNNTKEDGKE
jgi:large-conductance mechanosensitive channel